MREIRQSILGNYEKCPRLCWEKWGSYGEAEPTHQSGDDDDGLGSKYAGTGIKFHEVMEAWGMSQIAGTELEASRLHDMMDVKFAELDKSIFTDEYESETFYNSLHEGVDWAYDKLVNTVPIAVEWNFRFDDLIPELPTCTGTVDRIQGSMVAHDVDLIDFKTGALYTKKELSNNIQATMYALAFEKQFGFLPKRFLFYFTKHRRIKEIMITPLFLEAGKARIMANWIKIQTGHFEPNRSKDIWYFCKNFCDSTTCSKKKRFKQKPKGWEGVGFEIFKPNQNIGGESNGND